MIFERILDNSHPLFNEALKLYNSAFPPVERRSLSEHERVMSNAEFYCNAITENGAFIGIAFFWETENFVFLEHFAILPELRNGGYGARALDLLKSKGKTFLLEIEPPVDGITQRRYGFYKRNGFLITPFRHVQAKYYIGAEDFELKVLSYPRVLTQSAYDAFLDYTERNISARC